MGWVRIPDGFRAAMDDDLNVPAALATLHDAVRAGNTALDSGDDETASNRAAEVHHMAHILGLWDVPEAGPAEGSSPADAALSALVEAQLQARAEAKSAKDFGTADAIRDRLTAAGVQIEDTPAGAKWSLTKGGA